jgi:hypothetical protein
MNELALFLALFSLGGLGIFLGLVIARFRHRYKHNEPAIRPTASPMEFEAEIRLWEAEMRRRFPLYRIDSATVRRINEGSAVREVAFTPPENGHDHDTILARILSLDDNIANRIDRLERVLTPATGGPAEAVMEVREATRHIVQVNASVAAHIAIKVDDETLTEFDASSHISRYTTDFPDRARSVIVVNVTPIPAPPTPKPEGVRGPRAQLDD